MKLNPNKKLIWKNLKYEKLEYEQIKNVNKIQFFFKYEYEQIFQNINIKNCDNLNLNKIQD
jgi:hypothetical protein